MNLSPIIYFAYNRPVHTKKTLEYLKRNKLAKKSLIYFFLDAAKDKYSKDKVLEVRKIIKNVKGFKKKKIIIRKKNLGVAGNIIEGVTRILKKHEKIIVVEDDILTSPYFLKYMNDALNLYKDENKVAAVSGYSYPIINKYNDYFFLKMGECWGWATWKSSWEIFEKNGIKLLKIIKKNNHISEFNFDDSYDFVKQLENFCLKKNQSWAIRWYASIYLNNKFTLYPPKSLVKNIGMDGFGVHSVTTTDFDSNLMKKYIKPKKILIRDSKYHREKIKLFFRKIKSNDNLFSKIKKKIIYKKNAISKILF